jgi:hypothetical protein
MKYLDCMFPTLVCIYYVLHLSQRSSAVMAGETGRSSSATGSGYIPGYEMAAAPFRAALMLKSK